ncbi:MAG TPA: DMT family transporter [Aliiroseovarius sp.]|nr:DMT family transporter [Aliiroseovarius sp.]
MRNDTRKGILFMVAATATFAMMDAMSRHVAARYSVILVVMIRYWFFAAFVLVQAARRPGGLRAAAGSAFPLLQALRGVLLAAEVCFTVTAFVLLGLIETHALFASFPLMIAALSGPVLGERVGWRRWVGIGAGFVGVLIILDPGSGVFSPGALIALSGALIFATYGLLTRYVARQDSATTSLFWTGITGAVVMSAVGAFFWQPIALQDGGWVLTLSAASLLGHWLLIKCYDAAEASVVQPFAFLQLVFITLLGVGLFGESLRTNVVIGAAIVVAAGLFTLWRGRSAAPHR